MKAVETEFPLVVNSLPSPGLFKTPGWHSMLLMFSNLLMPRRNYLLRETGTYGKDQTLGIWALESHDISNVCLSVSHACPRNMMCWRNESTLLRGRGNQWSGKRKELSLCGMPCTWVINTFSSGLHICQVVTFFKFLVLNPKARWL